MKLMFLIRISMVANNVPENAAGDAPTSACFQPKIIFTVHKYAPPSA